MDNTKFNEIAENSIEDLSEFIEKADKEFLLDVEIDSGVLHITLEDGGQYAINKHEATSQIWLSSPVSGAKYFSYDENDGLWHDDDQNELFDFVSSELSQMVDLSF